MKRTVFLALALFALMAVGVYAQTEADFTVSKSKDGKSITIDGYKGKATAVTIPAKIQNLPVTKIGEQAFGTSKITSVTIPNTVTSIERGAFATCAYLTSVNFQGTITASGFTASAFGSGMTSLGDIRDKYLAAGGGAGTYTRPDDNSKTWTKSASATAASAAGNTLLAFTAINSNKEYSVNKGTFSSGDVVIPASYNNLPVTAIENYGFTGLIVRSLTIPNSIKTIGINAFANCVMLTSVTIPSSVTSIGNNAFINIDSLTSVTIQGTIPSNNFFGFDGDLKTKYLAGGAGTYTRPAKGATWTKEGASTAAPAANAGTAGLAFTAINNNKEYSVAKGTVTSGAVVIPASYNNLPVTTIADNAFSETKITAVTIPNSVTKIGSAAFNNCTSLPSITIPSSVTSIGDGAFNNCQKLTSVTFQGTIPANSIKSSGTGSTFQGDLIAKYIAGGAGTYTTSDRKTWTKK